MSDLRANTVRSLLAEFLVAQALGVATKPRVEWDSCDVRLPNGSCIEVKASGYLQAWNQRALSKPIFGGFKARTWSPETGTALETTYNAEVYVFALLTAERHDEYDALDTSTWRFWVIPHFVLAGTGQASLSLGGVRRLAGPHLNYDQLAAAVRAAVEYERSRRQFEAPHVEDPGQILCANAPAASEVIQVAEAPFAILPTLEGKSVLPGTVGPAAQLGPYVPRRHPVESLTARRVAIAPSKIAHLEGGCGHKEDNDFTRWGYLDDVPDAWQRLGNGERLQSTSGANLVAMKRCKHCVASA
jgi:hypothetical protein